MKSVSSAVLASALLLVASQPARADIVMYGASHNALIFTQEGGTISEMTCDTGGKEIHSRQDCAALGAPTTFSSYEVRLGLRNGLMTGFPDHFGPLSADDVQAFRDTMRISKAFQSNEPLSKEDLQDRAERLKNDKGSPHATLYAPDLIAANGGSQTILSGPERGKEIQGLLKRWKQFESAESLVQKTLTQISDGSTTKVVNASKTEAQYMMLLSLQPENVRGWLQPGGQGSAQTSNQIQANDQIQARPEESAAPASTSSDNNGKGPSYFCSVTNPSDGHIRAGMSVSVSGTATGLNPKKLAAYAWLSDLGFVSGTSNVGTIDNVTPGTHEISGNVSQGKGHSADCTVKFEVTP